MAASTDPNKIVGALDTMGSSLDGGASSNITGAAAPDKASPFPTPAWNSMSTADQESAPSIPKSAFTPSPAPSAAPYTIPAANENDSVQGRVAGLISNNSDLMKLAAQNGQELANRRGLGNSSIAVGASQAEVLKAATPIATADANIAAQKNLGREAQSAQTEQLRQQLASSDSQQAKSIASQMALLQTQLASASDLQKSDIQAQMDRLVTSGQQSIALQTVQDSGAMSRLQSQLSSSDNQQAKDIAAQMTRLQTQLAGSTAQQQADIQAQMARLVTQGQQALTLQGAGDTASMQRLQAQLSSSDNQQARDIGAQMTRLQTQIDAAAGQQKLDLQGQMDRLVTSGQQALGLQGAQDTGAMSRLQAQLAASSSQQDKDLAAQMARVQTDAAAQMSRLQTQLSSSDAQQQVAIKAQMDQLNATTQQHLTEMAAASGYDVTKLQVASGLDVARDAAQAKNSQDLAKVQGSIQSALQSQGNSEQIQRMGVDLQNQLQVQGGQLAVDLKKISAAGDQDIRRLVEAANQERVTLQQSIAAQDRDRMATAMVNTFQIEAQMRAALLGNNNIPASERAGYEQSISALGDPIRAYINQLFGSGASPASSTVTPASPTAPVGATTPPVGSPPATPPEGTPPPGAPIVNAPGGGLLQDTSPLGNQMATLPASVLNSNGAPITSTTPITTTYPTTPGGLIPNIGGLTSDERRQLGMAIQ